MELFWIIHRKVLQIDSSGSGGSQKLLCNFDWLKGANFKKFYKNVLQKSSGWTLSKIAKNLYVRVFFLALDENIARIARESFKILILHTIYEHLLTSTNW